MLLEGEGPLNHADSADGLWREVSFQLSSEGHSKASTHVRGAQAWRQTCGVVPSAAILQSQWLKSQYVEASEKSMMKYLELSWVHKLNKTHHDPKFQINHHKSYIINTEEFILKPEKIIKNLWLEETPIN
jgi:hypothetical protein